MVWDAKTSNGFESDKICSVAIHYLRGRYLDIGCGMRKVWNNAIGVDNRHHFGQNTMADVVGEGLDLSIFGDKSMDSVFSAHMLEHVVDYKAALKEWWRVIKVGGYLILYLPHKKFYPNIGEPGANPDHKHDFMPDDIIEAMKETGSWTMLENEERNQTTEYSFYQVYQKLAETETPVHEFKIWERNPNGLKRCLIIRYGAVGDMLMTSSILPALKKKGYYITYNTTPFGKEILEHDPHIDEWMLQETDQVPNPALGSYWGTLAMEKRWDKIINLCESIEGTLLTLPDKIPHQYSAVARNKIFNVNYLERTHDIAGVGHEFNQKFYATDAEKEWVKSTVKELVPDGAPIILWAINGSSGHKVYPYSNVVMAWLTKHTNAHIFIVTDPGIGVKLQDAIILTMKQDGYDISRVHPMGGKWKIREVLSFTVHGAHVVVGPETGPLNAAAFEPMPKVIYLSHSSHENLTKHWVNTTVLTPPIALCPCYPCHQLHYTWDFCPQDKATAAALCATHIKEQKLFDKILEALGGEKIRRVA